MHGPGPVAGTGPRSHGGEVAAGVSFVAERPHDDARVVLVPFDHAGHAVEVRRFPPRVVAGVAFPADLGEAVGFQVAFVDHPQPVLVAQVEEGRVRRVVRGADGVDVVLFHQQYVGQRGFVRHSAAQGRVVFVPVDALQQDACAVDLELTVLNGHCAEADPHRHALVVGGQVTVVQPGDFGCPRLHDARVDRRVDRCPENAQLRYGKPCGSVHRDPDLALAGGVVVVGAQPEVRNAAHRSGEQRDVAEDPGQPPHVLVLQVTPGRPLVYADREHIGAYTQHMRDVELDRQAASARDTQLNAVEPNAAARVDAVEPKDRGLREPGRREIEREPVVTGRVVRRNVWRVHRERVLHVRVRGLAEAVHLPVRRNGHCGPRRIVERVLLDARGRVVRGGGEVEAPVPVEAQGRRVRGEGRTRWQGAVPRGYVVDVGHAHLSPLHRSRGDVPDDLPCPNRNTISNGMTANRPPITVPVITGPQRRPCSGQESPSVHGTRSPLAPVSVRSVTGHVNGHMRESETRRALMSRIRRIRAAGTWPGRSPPPA
ncbi:hypothetical protein KIPE111705_43800 [Kibdelosporangium persicum]